MYLILPLILTLISATVSLFYGLTALNRRVPIQRLSWLLALSPLSAFAWLLSLLPELSGGKALALTIPWMPSLGLNASLYFDSLAVLFALMVTGIGTLVVVYTGYYFKGQPGAWRFLTYIFLFMTAMLGLVLAGDVLTLFVFWEGTSVTSFLLVAYKSKDADARKGATKALLITGGGGIALLAGLLLITSVTGSSEFSHILGSGEVLRQSPLYMAILGLISLGAFTKSAQSPFHIWLPQAMSAPTPASAYLHSATMVKAGIYLLARLNPVLGLTAAWFWLLTLVGLLTMLSGAYLGLKQNDLKALLAYSTITQLGVLVMLIGQDTEIAFKALVIGVLAHALYKSSLFLSVGIIDHEAGTRDLRRLGGLWRRMPATFAIASLAAMSMAGLPPMFGFLAKETLLATVTHPDVPLLFARLLTGSTVVAGALLLAQAFMLVVDAFLGKPRSSLSVHEAPLGMWLAPAIPALLSFFVSILPEPELLAVFLADAAAAAFGAKVKVSLAIWTGLSVPLLLSILAVGLGSLLFINRNRLRVIQSQFGETITWNALYDGLMTIIDRGAYFVTRTQTGRLRYYLAAILTATSVLVLLFGRLPIDIPGRVNLGFNLGSEIVVLRIFSLLLSVAASLATIFLRRDLYAILALGASGLSLALLMVLEPAPDVALVQIIVDILLIVILVLTLTRLPKTQRDKARELTYLQSRPGLVRDALIALISGLILSLITLNALASRPRASQVTPFYAENAKPLAGATDIVGAIVVDFRALDTLIEISVFAMAGLGVYTLIRFASRKAGDPEQPAPEPVGVRLNSRGIGGGRASPLIRMAAFFVLPVSMMLAATHLMYGHDQPGDGFTAGVIIGLAIGLWYVVFGYDEARQRLPWGRPIGLISMGLGLAALNAVTPALFGYPILAHLDYGKLVELPLPRGFSLSTAFIFELAICVSVLGGVIAMLNALGHPRTGHTEPALETKEV